MLKGLRVCASGGCCATSGPLLEAALDLVTSGRVSLDVLGAQSHSTSRRGSWRWMGPSRCEISSREKFAGERHIGCGAGPCRQPWNAAVLRTCHARRSRTVRNELYPLRTSRLRWASLTINRERFNAMDDADGAGLPQRSRAVCPIRAFACVVIKGARHLRSGADLEFIRAGGTAGRPRVSDARGNIGAGLKARPFSMARSSSRFSNTSTARSPKCAAHPNRSSRLSTASPPPAGLVSPWPATWSWRRSVRPSVGPYSKTGLTGAEKQRLCPRPIGLRRSFELLFLNPRLDALAARDYGLVTTVLPVEGFNGKACWRSPNG